MITLLMPCAGRSTRFNGLRPKYLLTHPSGNLMLIEALSGLDTSNVSNIEIILVKEHVEKFQINLKKISDKIFNMKNIVPNFIILEEFTSSQSETIYKAIIDKNISGPIFIKDCDNFFNFKIENANSVCVTKLSNEINAINKSYVSVDKYGFLSGIIEKQVIGDTFCVGGYSFSDASLFLMYFENVSKLEFVKKEIYISHVIQAMLLADERFSISEVSNYKDWGTIEDWNKYTSDFKTLFVDIDGVLVENSSEFFSPEWGESAAMAKNIECINDLYNKKTYIVLTTSRSDEYGERTLLQLQDLDIKYHQIIFNLPHGKRILINDYSTSNSYPSALAINIKRDDDSLKDFL
jgi:hypothetical protein